jgi:hypothetical protein
MLPDEGAKWPKELRAIEDLPWPVRVVSREELERMYPRDSVARQEDEDAKPV